MRSVLYRDLHYTGRTLYLADRGKKLRADELYSLTRGIADEHVDEDAAKKA